MAMPTYEQLLLPLLRIYAGGQEYSVRETIDILAKQFDLNEVERSELLPSGKQARFDNRVGWARTALRKAALLETTQSGLYRIAQRGRDVLARNPAELSDKFLSQFEEYRRYKGEGAKTLPQQSAFEQDSSTKSPIERLADAAAEINSELAEEVLARLKESSPNFFERVVVELLHKMGYGGTFRDAAQAIGASGDGGVDGVIKEDALGLDTIYVQAKRYTTNNVPARDIRDFKGALDEKNARKGVFLTTSGFAKEALEAAGRAGGKTVVLIDGKRLADLMIEHGVGTNVIETYTVSRLDTDYFQSQDTV